MTFAVVPNQFDRFMVGQVFDALLGYKMELYPETLVVRVDQTERMASEAVHVPIGAGYPPVAHRDGNLMQCLGKATPEVPVVVGAAQVGVRITFYRVVQIREFQGVAEKEDRCVVADQIPVAFFGIKLHGKATDVPFGIGCPTLTGNG